MCQFKCYSLNALAFYTSLTRQSIGSILIRTSLI